VTIPPDLLPSLSRSAPILRALAFLGILFCQRLERARVRPGLQLSRNGTEPRPSGSGHLRNRTFFGSGSGTGVLPRTYSRLLHNRRRELPLLRRPPQARPVCRMREPQPKTKNHHLTIGVMIVKMSTLLEAEFGGGLRRLSHDLPVCGETRPVSRLLPIWSILTRDRDENTHSSVLRWLFDPRESHGLGSAFLEEFYKRVFGRVPASTSTAFARCEVQSGSERADIVVCGRNWRLVIENKIDDANDRTIEYAKRWPGSDFAFLTPDGRAAKSSHFHSVPYRVIREILDDLVPRGDAAGFLNGFADHISLELEDK